MDCDIGNLNGFGLNSFLFYYWQHLSIKRSSPYVCPAYAPTGSWRARLTGKDKSVTIFQKKNIYQMTITHLHSVYDLGNDSYLRLIGGWMVEGLCVLCREWKFVYIRRREGNENISRKFVLVRMILLIFSTKRSPLPSCKVV
jgi:hypothetical protein